MINIRGQAIFNTHPTVRDYRRKSQTQDENGFVVDLDEKDITTIAKDKDGNVVVLDESKISDDGNYRSKISHRKIVSQNNYILDDKSELSR